MSKAFALRVRPGPSRTKHKTVKVRAHKRRATWYVGLTRFHRVCLAFQDLEQSIQDLERVLVKNPPENHWTKRQISLAFYQLSKELANVSVRTIL